ncbi:outer membrane beta-barrel protein [Cellulophaga tyrosinoxydans]|uniref:Putative beta-barrel porin-2, OmpL-like. bbp2 n=1 Tax=Cellulophaga tyrosinoxydans TaxID=504486 RepID=A0A1W2ALZ1_9FLAO|nr:outer membrane beta-barrel protein [Cellulophaga tyrosinoxydans]SMC61532.1 Putative beta-barrel porin-2, OmpL-like. bbp2 [Cellulophaga tyrosinoxydans]
MKTIRKTNYVKNIFLVASLFAGTAIFAQEEAEEEKKPLSISGTVDAYYRTNLSSSDVGSQAPGSSFANESGFALGMANVIASYEGAKTGAVADLAFGPRALQAAGGDAGIFVNQLYAYWNVSEGTKLTVGRFNTYLGYEVISPAANFNYSTSYLFSYGPFSHVGLKADFALSEDFSLMLAVMNVTDENFNGTSGSVPGAYSLGAQLGYSGQYLNFYYDGNAKLGFEIDYTGGFDLSDTFYLGLNAAYQDNDGVGFFGAAIYPQLATSDSFKIGLRGEYFAESGDYGAIGTGVEDSSVFTATLTGSYSIENLTIKPELRLDSTSDDAFFDNDGAASKSLSSFLIAAIYSF